MVLKGSVRAQDDVLYSLSQDRYTVEDSYAIFDASIVFQGHSDQWDATLFVKNIADEFYASSINPNNPQLLPNGYNHRYSKQSGRTYGLELRYRWF
jgi:outer membrane receptor protein involved in Fe transport